MASDAPRRPSPPPWIGGLLRAAFVNAVPLWGFVQEQWTPGTVLVLFWVQTVISIPLTAALIALHRSMTRKAGHYTRGSYLQQFTWVAVPFSMGHGLFLGLILGFFWKDAAGAVDWQDVRLGAIVALVVLVLGFAVEITELRRQSFAWMQQRAGGVLRRTLLVHFVILFGMAAAAFATQESQAFFAVFIVLKLLFDVAAELPDWSPAEPPRWLAAVAKRTNPGVDPDAEWKRLMAEQKKNAELAEQTIDSLRAAERAAR